jgi:26S proteasome regulatory subunit N2
MYEEKSIQKEKIAILISKVYYHLEEYQESVHFALESGDYFDMKQKSTFVDCIVSKGLSTYID